MNLVQQSLPLKAKSPQKWAEVACQHFDKFIVDHAACERKASALAMSFVVKYADRPALVEPMICLAKEELAHFHEVYRLIQKRGLSLSGDEKDPYVKQLLSRVRNDRQGHFLDRLLVSAVIEARGCERFYLISQALKDTELKDFYARLAREEAGHYKIFVNIAKQYFNHDEVEARLDQWWVWEAEAMTAVPTRPAVH